MLSSLHIVRKNPNNINLVKKQVNVVGIRQGICMPSATGLETMSHTTEGFFTHLINLYENTLQEGYTWYDTDMLSHATLKFNS